MLRTVIVYKRGVRAGEEVAESLKELFGFKQKESEILGEYHTYKALRNVIHLVPLEKSYEINVKEYEKRLEEEFGNVDLVLSLNPHINDNTQGIFVHGAGNVTREGILQKPRSVAPADPDFVSVFLQAVDYFASEEEVRVTTRVEATHDFPTRSFFPYLSVEVNGPYQDIAALALVAALGKRMRYEHALPIGFGYYASEFHEYLLEGEFSFAHYVPSYFHRYIDHELVSLIERNTVGGLSFIAVSSEIPGEVREKIVDSVLEYPLELEII